VRTLRYRRYGPADVLGMEDIAEPSPAAGQIKVRVRAVSLNPIDWKIRAGHLRFVPGFRPPPRGIGLDFAGEVVGVGGGAMPRHVGERVFGSLAPFGRDGALAQFLVTAADRAAAIPDGVSDEQAAALPTAGGTALQALRDEARIEAGQRVLVVGAAGGVGHFAVQIAKHDRAHVVGVCSERNAAFVRELGADEVVDYARDDFTRRDDRFDVVFDAAGASSFSATRPLLAEAGCYVSTAGTAAAAAGTVVAGALARLTSRQRAIALVLRAGSRLFERLAALAREGALRAHVERAIGLDEVADALAAMETGHGRGKVVVHL
jgi:NADPH:quinone reductase-like Zn-dependent oxidoreductase